MFKQVCLTLNLVLVMSSAFSLADEKKIDGKSPAEFYAQVHSEIDGSKDVRILHNNTKDWVRIDGKFSSHAKMDLRLSRDGNYEALYTEFGDLQTGSNASGIFTRSYRVDFENTVKGKWHLEGATLVLEGMGTATGIVTETTKKPGIVIVFDKDLQSEGLKGKKMNLFVLISMGG